MDEIKSFEALDFNEHVAGSCEGDEATGGDIVHSDDDLETDDGSESDE